jgi:hypothetical protein
MSVQSCTTGVHAAVHVLSPLYCKHVHYICAAEPSAYLHYSPGSQVSQRVQSSHSLTRTQLVGYNCACVFCNRALITNERTRPQGAQVHWRRTCREKESIVQQRRALYLPLHK